MPDNTLQINSIKRAIGSLEVSLGVTQLRQAQSEFTTTIYGIEKVQNALKALNISIPVDPLDNQYWFTSWDNWQKIIAVLNPIAQNFQWETDRFDCDNRANLMTSMTSLMFRINTCATLYCKVFMADTGAFLFYHYCNLITDDAGNVYLWDVDQNGISQKITGNPFIMGTHKYELISIRVY